MATLNPPATGRRRRPWLHPGQARGRAIIAFLVAVSILLTLALQRASAVEPQIVEVSNGYTSGATCSIYTEYDYTADNAWLDTFKYAVTTGKLGTIESDTVIDANTRTVRFKKISTMADEPGLCQKTSSNGVWFYTKTAIASLAANATYVMVLGLLFIAAGKKGYAPSDVRVTIVAGCLAGAFSNAVSNTILGINTWQQLLAGALTSCSTDALGQPVFSAFYEYSRDLARQNGWTPSVGPDAEVAAPGSVEQVEAYASDNPINL